MEPRPINQIARTCGGELLAGAPATLIQRICTDSRQVRAGDLFLALPGERFDGHRYLEAAIDRGAVAVMGERGKLGTAPTRCAAVAVENSRRALGEVAAAYRGEFTLPVIAVAGSNGKTTTKEMIAAVLAPGFRTLASEASFNNDVGVPLTLLGLDREHRAAVVEVGSNHPGELAPLLRWVRPTMGVLTSLGREHLEFFGDLDGVIREEGGLAEAIPADGVLLVNDDAPGIEHVLARTRSRTVRVGWSNRADWQILSAAFEEQGMSFCVRAPHPDYAGVYRVPAFGLHQVVNAVLALAVGSELGLRPDQLKTGIDAFRPPRMRLQLSEVNGIRLLDDCYNANADSMGAALETLQALTCAGRRFAVLGDMAELGAHGTAAHAEAGRRAAAAAHDLLAVGRMAPVTARAAREAGMERVAEFGDASEAAAVLAADLRAGDLVLFKASRAARFERLIEQVKAHWGVGSP